MTVYQALSLMIAFALFTFSEICIAFNISWKILLNLENLYKNGKGRRCGKYYNYLIFTKYGIKVCYEPYGECYVLIGTGIDPEYADWIYWYTNEEENAGEVVYDDSEADVCFGVGSHIAFLDKENFDLCLNNK